MEKSQTKFPADFAAEEEAYSQVLKNNLDVSTELPPWRSGTDIWSEWMQSLRDYANQIYEKYFKPDQAPKMDWINWSLVMKGLFYLMLFSVVVLVVYLVVSLIRKRSEPLKYAARAPDISIETREQRLVEMVKEKMAMGEWSQAAKLRWRLFLERKKLNSEVTPLEFEKDQKTSLPQAIDQYRNMFTPSKGDESWYLEYNRKLRELEGDS